MTGPQEHTASGRAPTHRIKAGVRPHPRKRFVAHSETETSMVGYVLHTYGAWGPYSYRKDELEPIT
jgi:hypothetical protein